MEPHTWLDGTPCKAGGIHSHFPRSATEGINRSRLPELSEGARRIAELVRRSPDGTTTCEEELNALRGVDEMPGRNPEAEEVLKQLEWVAENAPETDQGEGLYSITTDDELKFAMIAACEGARRTVVFDPARVNGSGNMAEGLYFSKPEPELLTDYDH
jgi:hypothetical protein